MLPNFELKDKMDISTAGPLVLETLTNACSQKADVLKPAERQLQQWETQPGFYSILSVWIFICLLLWQSAWFDIWRQIAQ